MKTVNGVRLTELLGITGEEEKEAWDGVEQLLNHMEEKSLTQTILKDIITSLAAKGIDFPMAFRMKEEIIKGGKEVV